MCLDTRSFLQRCKVLEPGYFGFWHSIDLTFHFATIDTNQVNISRSLDKLRILCHHYQNRLHHAAVIIDTIALIGTNIASLKAIDLKLDNTITGVVHGKLFTINLQILTFKLEMNRRHGKSIKVPGNLRAGILH